MARYRLLRNVTDQEAVQMLHSAGVHAHRMIDIDEEATIPLRERERLRTLPRRCTRVFVVNDGKDWAMLCAFNRHTWYEEEASVFDGLPEEAELFMVWTSATRLGKNIERVLEV